MIDHLYELGLKVYEKRWRILICVILAIAIFAVGMHVQSNKHIVEQESEVFSNIASMRSDLNSMTRAFLLPKIGVDGLYTGYIYPVQEDAAIVCYWFQEFDFSKYRNQGDPYPFPQTKEYFRQLKQYLYKTDYSDLTELSNFIRPVTDLNLDYELSLFENLQPLEDYFLTPEGQSLLLSLSETI